jgi:DnaJ-class molecular chaperone
MTRTCELCHGTGQRCYFGGESRFVLTWQDCPACDGTGEVAEANEGAKKDETDARDVARRDADG